MQYLRSSRWLAGSLMLANDVAQPADHVNNVTYANLYYTDYIADLISNRNIN